MTERKNWRQVRADVRGAFEDVSAGVITLGEAVGQVLENDMSARQGHNTVVARAQEAAHVRALSRVGR
jgi:hypothetical protein